MFHFLLSTAIVNAWILFKETSTRPRNVARYHQLHFRHELMMALFAGYSQRQKTIRVAPNFFGPGAEPNVVSHQNVHMRAKRARRCVGHKHFSTGKLVKDTVFGCRACGVFLCKECHAPFHMAAHNAQ
jgi:hypothetical protein